LTTSPASASVAPPDPAENEEKKVDQEQEILPEVRTRRLVIVDAGGVERASLKVHLSHVEMRLTLGREGQRCEVLCFAGEQEPGMFLIWTEFWADGESVGGCSMIRQGDKVELQSF
jgi:hypothetical protein